MSEGQVQLAMEENDERKGRDIWAIQWLIHNRTEDDEMESFVLTIPGTFILKWGIKLWRKVSEVMVTRSKPHLPNGGWAPEDPHAHGEIAIYDLCRRVRHLLETCDNCSLFAQEETWRLHTCRCIETVASLVFCTGLKLELFGDLGRLLDELGKVEKIRELLAAGSDGSFVMRWTCLSLVVVTRGISNNGMIIGNACSAINHLSWL